MSDIKKVKIIDVLESQIPEFLNEDSPLFREFLLQYFTSLESRSGSTDLAVNIKEYKDITSFTSDNLSSDTTLTRSVGAFSTEIFVESTVGFPETYGLMKIDNEIITYKSKTETSFVDCVRGFSGIASYHSINGPDELIFEDTESEEHVVGEEVVNVSSLFLKEFFRKLKTQFEL